MNTEKQLIFITEYERFQNKCNLPKLAFPLHRLLCFVLCIFEKDYWNNIFRSITNHNIKSTIIQLIEPYHNEITQDKEKKAVFISAIIDLINEVATSEKIEFHESSMLYDLNIKIQEATKKVSTKYDKISIMKFYFLTYQPNYEKVIQQYFGHIPDAGKVIIAFKKSNPRMDERTCIEFTKLILKRAKDSNLV